MGNAPLPLIALAYLADHEWNDLDEATRALQECFRIGELWKTPRLLVPANGLSALVMQARGQAEEANAMIHRAEKAARDSYSVPYDNLP